MKKVLLVLAIFVLAVVLAGTMSCKPKPNPIAPTGTAFVVFDDFSDGDNRDDTGVFGGYWYTYDDLTNGNTASTTTCGDSTVWPMSQNAFMRTPGVTTVTPAPTFIMSQYTILPSETPPVHGVASSEVRPAGVTSDYYARVYGVVDPTSAGYQYAFIGFGANVLSATNPDGSKQTINATALGYKRLHFWYKLGPTAGASGLWQVTLASSYQFNGGACGMTDNDDHPKYNFTATNTWQPFDHAFTEFTPNGWGTLDPATCGTRGAASACGAPFNPSTAQYACKATEAITALNAIHWQTQSTGQTTTKVTVDLEIAQICITE